MIKYYNQEKLKAKLEINFPFNFLDCKNLVIPSSNLKNVKPQVVLTLYACRFFI